MGESLHEIGCQKDEEVRDMSVDLVISNELLCDLLDAAQLEKALK